MTLERWVSLSGIALAVALYALAVYPENQEAYLFPQLVTVVMCVIGVCLLVTGWRKRAQQPESGPTVEWRKLTPILIVLLLFILGAEAVGFYASSFLMFAAIGVLYSPKTTSIVAAKRCLPVSVGFIAVLYAVFAILLRVQMPAGVLF